MGRAGRAGTTPFPTPATPPPMLPGSSVIAPTRPARGRPPLAIRQDGVPPSPPSRRPAVQARGAVVHTGTERARATGKTGEAYRLPGHGGGDPSGARI